MVIGNISCDILSNKMGEVTKLTDVNVNHENVVILLYSD